MAAGRPYTELLWGGMFTAAPPATKVIAPAGDRVIIRSMVAVNRDAPDLYPDYFELSDQDHGLIVMLRFPWLRAGQTYFWETRSVLGPSNTLEVLADTENWQWYISGYHFLVPASSAGNVFSGARIGQLELEQ